METQEQKDERMSWELFPDIPKVVVADRQQVLEAVGRLKAWLRDFGDQRQPAFVDDLTTVLDYVVKAV